jgi:hypothetical protein
MQSLKEYTLQILFMFHRYTVKPVYNEQFGAAKSVTLKASFRYNRSVYKEIYAIGENDMIRYKRELVITEFVINGFNCTYITHIYSMIKIYT